MPCLCSYLVAVWFGLNPIFAPGKWLVLAYLHKEPVEEKCAELFLFFMFVSCTVQSVCVERVIRYERVVRVSCSSLLLLTKRSRDLPHIYTRLIISDISYGTVWPLLKITCADRTWSILHTVWYFVVGSVLDAYLLEVQSGLYWVFCSVGIISGKMHSYWAA